MNEPDFSTRDQALDAAERMFLPAGTDWTTNTLKVTWNPELQLLSRFGALPSTMHFGLLQLDILKGSSIRITGMEATSSYTARRCPKRG